MTKKQLKQLEKAAADKLPNLLQDMTAVLDKHGIADMRVFSFEMEPLPDSTAVTTPVNEVRSRTVLPPGCVLLPNGKIFCG